MVYTNNIGISPMNVIGATNSCRPRPRHSSDPTNIIGPTNNC